MSMCKSGVCVNVFVCQHNQSVRWNNVLQSCLPVCAFVCARLFMCVCDRVMMRITLLCKAWCVSLFAASFGQKGNFKPKLTLRNKPTILHYINWPLSFELT